MRAIALLLVLVLAPSCAHVVPIVKDCSAETAAGLLDDVNTALSTGEYVDSLAVLVAKFGECVIVKAVKEVANQAGLRGQYDELEATKAKRAQAWLGDHGG